MANLYKKSSLKTDPKTGKKIKTESKKWWAQYRDSQGTLKRIPLAVNKSVAQQMLADIVARLEREKAGIVDPTVEEMKRPIAQHLTDFEKHQKSRNNTPVYIRELVTKIRRFIKHCRWRNVSQIKASDVENYLLDLREKEGLSIQTSNHYLRAIKTFVLWLISNHRLNHNPLSSVKKLNVRTDRRHDRRALSEMELARLIDVAENGPPAAGLLGPDRAMLYTLAAYTGFRKAELGSLTLRSFCLDKEPCTVTIQAGYSKHRREDVQIMHPALVIRFKEWVARKKIGPDDILFPISQKTCGTERSVSRVIEFDLDAARTFWIAESETEEEEKRRETSDFLRHKNSAGKYADFHCLRHTFITNLVRAKVSPKAAQTLARHSDISLTMNVYTHISEEEQIEAINSLPDIAGLGKNESQ
ncbi:MAG: tyrosine-type recombinase/integrase [Planctomycetaceae bacterium]|nr:tyrosine-type recombinase/integrase [Planctomycetaceae bacterium]